MKSLVELPRNHSRRWMFFSVMAAIGGLGWFYLMPQGFPVSHLRFWSNTVLPIGLAVLALVNVYVVIRKLDFFAFLLPSIPALATGLIFGCGFLYWRSLSNVSGVIVFGGWLYLCLSWWFFARPLKKSSLFWLSSGISVGLGVFWATTQAAPRATTLPIALNVPEGAIPSNGSSVKTFRSGKSILRLRPQLTFNSFSPDGFWTLFTPGFEPDSKVVGYFEETNDDTIINWTLLHERNWTHLNTFSEMFISGTNPLFISFSPCPNHKIAILPSEYPIGRPSRAAYQSSDGIFRVVEADSGEKGPFKILAEGFHNPSDPIMISIYDGAS